MRHLFWGLVLLILGGCGTASSVRLATQAPIGSSFEFQDQRQDDQRHTRIDRSAHGASTYLGDDSLQPSGPELLRAWLHRQLDAKLKGKEVALLEFTVQIYEPAVVIDDNALQSAAASTPNGYAALPFAGLMILGIERIRSEKSVRVVIQGTVASAEFAVTASEMFRGRVTESNLRETLEKALDQAVAEVDRLL